MSYIITRNVTQGNQTPQPILKENGELYLYSAITNEGKERGYYDSYADILDHIIGEQYSESQEKEKTELRVEHANSIRLPLQATFLSESDEHIDEDTMHILENPHQSNMQEWSKETPIVLLDIYYHPHTKTPAPQSTLEDVRNPRNIVWLRPSKEQTYIESLATAGYITLFTREQ